MKNRKMYLQLFEDDGGAGSGSQGGNAGNGGGGHAESAGATYSYEQAEEIASARANQPDVSAIKKECDAYKAKVEQMENEKILTGRGVKADDLDYVMFKVSQLVDDKTDFKKAAEKFLKENPRFTGQTYRVSTGTQSRGSDNGGNGNDFINTQIRRAAGR